MSDYINELVDVLAEELELADIEFERVLESYKETREKINHHLADLFIEYAHDGMLNYYELQANGVINQFKEKVQEEINKNIEAESIALVTILFLIFKRGYTKFLNKFADISIINIRKKDLSSSLIDEHVNFNWSGIHFLERVNKNQSALFATVWTTFIIGIQNGETVDVIAKKFNKHFDVKASQALRLFETEAPRVLADATEVIFKDNRILKVEYQSVLEENTCGECASYHGEVFELNDMSRPLIPRHARCKCFYVPANEYIKS
ncbi:minor capsid protein [Metabacillus fastidiosus]|uniref:minor capsid protein n=1 Tax=Metabacillus fastidiosus TaxID=1458 RepID=UPI003D2E27B8